MCSRDLQLPAKFSECGAPGMIQREWDEWSQRISLFDFILRSDSSIAVCLGRSPDCLLYFNMSFLMLVNSSFCPVSVSIYRRNKYKIYKYIGIYRSAYEDCPQSQMWKSIEGPSVHWRSRGSSWRSRAHCSVLCRSVSGAWWVCAGSQITSKVKVKPDYV